MSTLSKEHKDLTAEGSAQIDRRGASPSDEPVSGTIIIGQGSMNERLQDAAVTAYLAKSQGPSLPPALVKKARQTVQGARDFWDDETSVPVGEPTGGKRTIALALLGLVSLILLTAWYMGPLQDWFQRVVG